MCVSFLTTECSFCLGVALILWVVACLTQTTRFWNVIIVVDTDFLTIICRYENDQLKQQGLKFTNIVTQVCPIAFYPTVPYSSPLSTFRDVFLTLVLQPASWWHEWPRQIHRLFPNVEMLFFGCAWSKGVGLDSIVVQSIAWEWRSPTAHMQCISTLCSWVSTSR